jgi:hypothetical protein
VAEVVAVSVGAPVSEGAPPVEVEVGLALAVVVGGVVGLSAPPRLGEALCEALAGVLALAVCVPLCVLPPSAGLGVDVAVAVAEAQPVELGVPAALALGVELAVSPL